MLNSEVGVRVPQTVRWCALAGLTLTLALAAPAISAATQAPPPPEGLPACPVGAAPTRPPVAPAGRDAPGACRAAGHVLESGVRLARRGEAGFTPSGYHHLGANTGGEWGGISGRFSVVDGSVRPNTYDFVAGRFMAKRNTGKGNIAWLEAGWAETGWSGPGRQHIYTFNTNTKTWQFYPQYVLRPGDKVWLDLHADSEGVWSAWLWWGDRWNLLTAQQLPIGSAAVVEQYVEVHVDAGRPGRLDVPSVLVDNVRLRPAGGGEARFWREDVPTLTGVAPGQQQRRGGFCLNWLTRYDTWTAGDCLDRGLLRPPPPKEPLPLGDAEVVNPAAPTATPSAPASESPAAPSESAVPTPTARRSSPAHPAPPSPAPPNPTARPGLLDSLFGRG